MQNDLLTFPPDLSFYTTGQIEPANGVPVSDYPSNWDSLRHRVYDRDDWCCSNCPAQGRHKGNAELHAHHIVPISKGGTHEISNLTTLCKKCHDSIHTSAMAPTAESRHDDAYDYETGSKSRPSSRNKNEDTVYETTNGTRYAVTHGDHSSTRKVELYDSAEEKPYKNEFDPEDLSAEEAIGLLIWMVWIGITLYLAWQTGSILWGFLLVVLSLLVGATIHDWIRGHPTPIDWVQENL